MLKKILVVVLLLSGTWGTCSESRSAALQAKLLSVFPDSLSFRAQASKRLLEFCPDETCIEFELPASRSNQELLDNALIYLFYFGDYYELQKWRSLQDTENDIAAIMAESRITACTREKMKACVRTEMRSRGLKVRNVRYDEGKRVAVQVW